METVLLDKNIHDRNSFDCEVAPLNSYLKKMASQQSKKDNSRTFVLISEENPSQIVGFYTLTMTTIELSQLPEKIKNHHSISQCAALLARLAVDKKYKGRRAGAWLLADALKRVLIASEGVGFPMVIVDAKDGVDQFYKKFEFKSFLNEEKKLYKPISDIRKDYQ